MLAGMPRLSTPPPPPCFALAFPTPPPDVDATANASYFDRTGAVSFLDQSAGGRFASAFDAYLSPGDNGSAGVCPTPRRLSAGVAAAVAAAAPAIALPPLHRSPSPTQTLLQQSDETFDGMAASITCFFWFAPSSVLSCVASGGATQVLLNPVCVSSADFKSFVAGILHRTQVSHTVVALALLYIYRLKVYAPSIVGTPGSEYRVFTVALVLANKFLDDNTYTNKTWAQVSKLPLSEITIMEVEFLSHINYELAVSRSKWEAWGGMLTSFVRARKSATFTCVSLPGSPVSSMPQRIYGTRKRKLLDSNLSPSPTYPYAKRSYHPVHAPREAPVAAALSVRSVSADQELRSVPVSSAPRYGHSVSAFPSDSCSPHRLAPPIYLGPPPRPRLSSCSASVVPIPLQPRLQHPSASSPLHPLPQLVARSLQPSHPPLPRISPVYDPETYRLKENRWVPQPEPAGMPTLVSSYSCVNPFLFPVVDKMVVPVPRVIGVRHPRELSLAHQIVPTTSLW
ncbi:cyclin-domain-containing protein [Limtongia smithiae]|uniref:cyclin-domain-containing protein n=1 Tax=Limtongia smithiae TaxID=1125753 RepID=UPI0034CFAD07